MTHPNFFDFFERLARYALNLGIAVSNSDTVKGQSIYACSLLVTMRIVPPPHRLRPLL